MNVIIPVGGLGTRLRPFTWSRPKPLVSVAGKPLLSHVLDSLNTLTIDRIVFVTGFLGEQIEDFVRSNFDFDAVFVRQDEPLGQSHAINQARGHITGPTMIVFPDMIFEADLHLLESLPADGAIFVKEVDDPRRFGVVELSGDRVTAFTEKPEKPVSNLAIMGIYYVKEVRKLFSAIDRQMSQGLQIQGEYFLADALQMLIDEGDEFTTIPASIWEDCGTIKALLAANRFLLSQMETAVDIPGSVIIPPVYIASTAKVINSVIGPHTSIGDGVTVADAIVRDSIVDSGSTIESTVLMSSIVGRNAVVRGEPMRVNVGDSSDVDLRSMQENGRG